jgi:hypothetical protein
MATATELKKQIKALEANLKNKSKYKPNVVQKLEEKLKTAKAELSKLTKSSTKKPSVLQKLKKMVNSKADLKIYKKPIDKSGRKTDLKKDGDVSALPMGKRITQNVGGRRVAGKNGKAQKGNVYYEYRANRIDVRQPSVKVKKPNKLEMGGELTSFEQQVKNALKQENKWHFINEMVDGQNVQLKMFPSKTSVDVQIFKIDGIHARMPKNYVGKRETLKMIMDNFTKMAEGGMMAKGGLTKEAIVRTLTSDKEQYFLQKDNDGYILYISPRGALNSTFHQKFNVEDLGNEGTRRKYRLTKMEDGGMMADGGTTQKYFLSFNYNPSNLKNEEAERIVSKYTKDWKHDNDFDEVSFFVMGLTMDKAKELESELMMEDAYNIEITKSRYADGGMMADDEQVNLDEKVEEYMNKLKNGEKIKRYFYVRGKSNPKYFETIIKNNSEKDAFKRYESTSQNSLGTLQNEYMSEDDVKRYLKKTISEIRADKEKNGTMAKGGSVLERLKKAKEMGIKGYGKAKEYTKKQIHDQKKKVALDVIVDTLNDDYFDTKKGRKDIRAVRITEELVEEHYAKGGMTDVRMKYAKKDIETLQKEGFMSIYDTKYGVIHLSYNNGNFTIKNNQYNPSIEDYKIIFEGNKEEAVKFLADAYVVEMAKGGMQGYDDREDERLGMEYGKMANKDFVGSHKAREHSRRDDARFEERNIMEMGGKVQYKSHRLNK